MTKGDINLLYVEVESLLKDICKFLNEEISNGYISHGGRSLANMLIERSKKQLQTITKVTASYNSDCTSEPYVDMQGYKVNNDEEQQEIYSDVVITNEPETIPNSVVVEDKYSVCPFANLPASESKDGKYGNIHKKEKILFFEQYKKVFAAVKQSWLLIYMNESASKPCQTFDLLRYEARPSSLTMKDTKRRDDSFELVGLGDSKLYHFTALTSKDMMQWISAINRQSENINLQRSLPPVPDKNVEEFNAELLDSTNDYEPLQEYQPTEKNLTNKLKFNDGNKMKVEQSLPLPPRNIPQKEVRQPSPLSSKELILEDDSDIYDSPENIKEAIKSIITNTASEQVVTPQVYEDEVYDYLQHNIPENNHKESTPVNEEDSNVTAVDTKKQNDKESVKTKSTLKSNILFLRHRKKDN